MNIVELKAAVTKEREFLQTYQHRPCAYSASGPVGLKVIEAFESAVEALDKRLSELERAMGAKGNV